MKKNNFINQIFTLFLIINSVINAQSTQEHSRQKHPNFLFILVDDQPFDALGMSGRYPFLETPNIDRLAEEGANLENFFVTQSICSPSRASSRGRANRLSYKKIFQISTFFGQPIYIWCF